MRRIVITLTFELDVTNTTRRIYAFARNQLCRVNAQGL